MTRLFTAVAIVAASVALLVSCGQPGTGGNSGDLPGDTGGVSARLVFPSNAGLSAGSQSAQPLALDLTGIVDTIVLNASRNGSVVASASFSYHARSGALLGIPPGNQYLIAVEAMDSGGNTLYRSSKSAIPIQQEVVRNIGTLHMVEVKAGNSIFRDSLQNIDIRMTSSIAVGDISGMTGRARLLPLL
jgi:hypothetical protein